MTMVTTSHIEIDERGVAYIEGKQTRVIQVVMDQMSGMMPEEIHRAYPYLSRAEIHAALAYYYDHQAALDEEIKQDHRAAEIARQEAIAAGTQPTLAQLEARLHAKRKAT
jgi:uncharacterized protein (DUF433 family)